MGWSRIAGLSAVLLAVLVLGACSQGQRDTVTAGQALVDYDILLSLPERPIPFREAVQPVLERRCVVCHGCFDAPCQLKLSSHQGLVRGASKEKVYDGARINAIEPTRLFIDADSTEQWRGKGFHPVIDETNGDGGPVRRLENSLLYRLLRLKQRHPQPRVGMLPDSMDIGLDRKQTCPTLEEFDRFADTNPKWGMPYAMPNLSDSEYATLVQWLAQGAQVPPSSRLSPASSAQLVLWENWLNGSSLKQRVVSRYLFEHLFQGHLHFDGAPEREFFRLVRSYTPSGEPIKEVATPRPYDDPVDEHGDRRFYYRLRHYDASIVAKDHVVYRLSDAKLQRFKELFLAPDYVVTEFPPYTPEIASNPFKAFSAIPVESRYRFLLDDSRFFIEGFIKGPVCRGQIALNVIEDQFWVAFFDPGADKAVEEPEFLIRMADNLQLPSAEGDDPSLLRLFSVARDYTRRESNYLRAKSEYFKSISSIDVNHAMRFIWDGDGGSNPNAALTIFRHLDSASVAYGFVGDFPETAWVIGYTQLERIHYLLVAGFNVFGNVNHQLNTRLFMDFLRMEGEDHFLAFLPTAQRRSIRASWYRGIREGLDESVDGREWLDVESVFGYRSGDPQRELYGYLMDRLGTAAEGNGYLERCSSGACDREDASPQQRRVDRAMRRIADMAGEQLQAFPDLSFLQVRSQGGQPDLAYTLVRNKAYKSVSSLLKDESQREASDLANDTLTVVPWLEGSYPNFFFSVDLKDIEAFADGYITITTRDEYERFVGLYGIRRTNDRFWPTADWFHEQYAREKPVLSGLFDLNRYQNR